MEAIGIKLHSITDLITNSSTTIFTRGDNTVTAVRTLVEELLKVFGRKEKAEDIFSFAVLCDNYYSYYGYVKRNIGKFPEFVNSKVKNKEEILKIIRSSGLSQDLITKVEKEVSEVYIDEEIFEKLYDRVVSGEQEKPKWFFEAEGCGNWEDETSTYLYIIPKDKKYEKLAQAIKSAIYSPSWEANNG